MDVEWVDSGELAAIEAALAAAERRKAASNDSIAARGAPHHQPPPWQAPAGAFPAQQAHGGGMQPQGYAAQEAAPRPGFFTHAPPSGGLRPPAPQPQQQPWAQQPSNNAPPGGYGYGPSAPAPAAAAPHYGGGATPAQQQASYAPPAAFAPAPPAPQIRCELRLLPDARAALTAWPQPPLGSPVAAALEAEPSATWDAAANAWLMPAASVGALSSSAFLLTATVCI